MNHFKRNEPIDRLLMYEECKKTSYVLKLLCLKHPERNPFQEEIFSRLNKNLVFIQLHKYFNWFALDSTIMSHDNFLLYYYKFQMFLTLDTCSI